MRDVQDDLRLPITLNRDFAKTHSSIELMYQDVEKNGMVKPKADKVMEFAFKATQF